MNYQKAGCIGEMQTSTKNRQSSDNSIQHFWNEHIMERFIKANLFIICCVAAGLLLIVYLGAFSCEVSWILEAHGELPISAYILCTEYFIVFVATTILIHGLVTGLSWGLFVWSIVIGLLSIPELVFVMMMTTQHWGLQSVHGLTELISYLIRLVINCFSLICVIPTAIRWRREIQVLCQLQGLATRLQLQTPAPLMSVTKADSRRSSQRMSGFDNVGYQITEDTKMAMGPQAQCLNMLNANNANQLYGSQNEFNASVFAPALLQQMQNGFFINMQRPGNRTQSLMDLRCTLPGMYNPRYVLETEDKNAKYFNITIDDLKNNLQDSNKQSPPSLIGSTTNDPIYCSIEPKQLTPPPKNTTTQQQNQQQQQQAMRQQRQPIKLARNCVSLENLEGINKVQNDLAAYHNNLLQNYTQQQQQQQYYLAMLGYIDPLLQSTNLYRRPSVSSIGGFTGNIPTPTMQQLQQQQRRNSQQLQYYSGFGYANYTNPYITANSKLSLGNESDDYRKYRDVAL